MANEAASRIVEIQKSLNLGQGDVYSLQQEQRRLWDENFEGRSYDEIEVAAFEDAWLRKKQNA